MRGDRESIYTELALCGSKNECARTDNVFVLISEVCDGTVTLDISVELCFWRFRLETVIVSKCFCKYFKYNTI